MDETAEVRPLESSDHVCGAVLLVEDDPNVQSLVRTILARVCERVDVLDDGEEAIEQLGRAEYDVVVLDLMLPGKNGFEVAAAVAQIQPKARLIVMSAIARHFADRFDSNTIVLQKPFDVDQLAAAVRDAARPPA